MNFVLTTFSAAHGICWNLWHNSVSQIYWQTQPNVLPSKTTATSQIGQTANSSGQTANWSDINSIVCSNWPDGLTSTHLGSVWCALRPKTPIIVGSRDARYSMTIPKRFVRRLMVSSCCASCSCMAWHFSWSLPHASMVSVPCRYDNSNMVRHTSSGLQSDGARSIVPPNRSTACKTSWYICLSVKTKWNRRADERGWSHGTQCAVRHSRGGVWRPAGVAAGKTTLFSAQSQPPSPKDGNTESKMNSGSVRRVGHCTGTATTSGSGSIAMSVNAGQAQVRRMSGAWVSLQRSESCLPISSHWVMQVMTSNLNPMGQAADI